MTEEPESPSSSTTLHLSRRKRVMFAAVLILLLGLSVEVLLNVLCVVAPPVANTLNPPWQSGAVSDQNSPIVDDDILGHRPRPHYSDHDSRGFRNGAAIDRVDIVCLGDSQTYGTGVSREDAWPHQLAVSSGQSVYSMAYGGWGPTHSEVLLEEAKQLRPKLIIEGFYAGNDLWDCYNMVYGRHRLNNHQSSAPEIEAAILKANELDPLDTKIHDLFRIYCGQFENNTDERTSVGRGNVDAKSTTLRGILSKHSRIYGLCRAIKNRLQRDEKVISFDEESWKKLCSTADSSQGKWEVFESPPFHSIFVPEYRLAALNMNDPRIREGQRIALDAIANISVDLSLNNTQFLVVLIPTKLLVFSPQVERPSDAYSELVTNEEEMWTKTKAYLAKSEIAFVDTLPAFRDAVNKGIQPYKISADGHPNAAGHRVISDVVLQWVRDNAR